MSIEKIINFLQEMPDILKVIGKLSKNEEIPKEKLKEYGTTLRKFILEKQKLKIKNNEALINLLITKIKENKINDFTPIIIYLKEKGISEGEIVNKVSKSEELSLQDKQQFLLKYFNIIQQIDLSELSY